MVDLNVSVHGDKVVISNLQGISSDIPKAIVRGLVRVAKGIHRAAYDWLSGAGGIYKTSSSGKSRRKIGDTAAGGYPVPVRTGHLRRLLDWLHPGESKSGEIGTFTAGPGEVVIYDSALYGDVIHEGWGSSAKFGPRQFLTDALTWFNQGGRIKQTIEEEIQTEITRRG